MRYQAGQALTVVDLVATAVFAIEGSVSAVTAGVDVFGLLVIGFTVALVGGVIRDLLIGDHPPAALRSYWYPGVAFAGAAAVFVAFQLVTQISPHLLTVLDAAGLGLFAVTGAEKAMDHGLNALATVLLATVTAVGGGVVRDVLLNRLPTVLSSHIYAVAAIGGALVMVVLVRVGMTRWKAMVVGGVVCFVIRLVSVGLDWNLPHVTS